MVTSITLGSHSGTHIDAPKHFFSSSKSIDVVPLKSFIGEAVILDVFKSHIGEGISDQETLKL